MTALPRAHAAAPSYFEGTASADALDVALAPGDQALALTPDAGGVIAQARVNSFATSNGFGSHPYPSDPVAGQLGSNYPFYVSSSYPAVPKQMADSPASHLSAVSEKTMSAAHASGSPQLAGSDLGSSDATVKVTALPDGSITATADTSATGITIAGVLTLADVRSHASITRSASGRVTSAASLDIGAVTVAGQSVALTDHGLQAAGQVVPLPVDAATQALQQAGLTVKLIKADRAGTTAAAPAIQITYAGDVPKVGAVKASFLVGYASASFTTKGGSGPSVPTIVGSYPTLDTSSQQPAPVRGLAGAPLSPGSAPSGVTAPLVVPTSAPASVAPRLALAQVGQVLPPYSWLSLYVLTLAGALTVGLGAQLLRLLGVRAR